MKQDWIDEKGGTEVAVEEMIIDPEFEQRIPPITQEEFDMLEENILADGEERQADQGQQKGVL